MLPLRPQVKIDREENEIDFLLAQDAASLAAKGKKQEISTFFRIIPPKEKREQHPVAIRPAGFLLPPLVLKHGEHSVPRALIPPFEIQKREKAFQAIDPRISPFQTPEGAEECLRTGLSRRGVDATRRVVHLVKGGDPPSPFDAPARCHEQGGGHQQATGSQAG